MIPPPNAYFITFCFLCHFVRKTSGYPDDNFRNKRNNKSVIPLFCIEGFEWAMYERLFLLMLCSVKCDLDYVQVNIN